LRAVQNPAYRLADVKSRALGGKPPGARQVSPARQSHLACLLNGFHGEEGRHGIEKAFSSVRRPTKFSTAAMGDKSMMFLFSSTKLLLE
jgi:hypothetical protein